MVKALLLVDIQNDFLPGGALAVPDGDAVISVANRGMETCKLIVATQDWHPVDHGSFANMYPGKKPGDHVVLNGVEQVLWPVHAVQKSHGAELASGLNRARINRIFRKGMLRDVDSYSAFFDNDHIHETGLKEYLTAQKVTELFIMGLATDYCVKWTAIDACRCGFATRIVYDGIRGVELQSGDVQRALGEMQEAGAKVVRMDEL